MSVITENQKEIYQMVSNGSAFLNPLTSGASSLTTSVTSTVSGLNTLLTNISNSKYSSQFAAAGLTSATLTSAISSAPSLSTAASQLSTYGDKAISEFSQRAQIADSYTKNQKSFADNDVGCSAINNSMGIVKTTGNQMISAYQSVVSSVSSIVSQINTAIASGVASIQSLAQQAVTYINSLITKAQAAIKEVTDAIQAEADEIAKQVASSAHAWLARVMSDWFTDSCKKDVMTGICTTELQSKIS